MSDTSQMQDALTSLRQAVRAYRAASAAASAYWDSLPRDPGTGFLVMPTTEQLNENDRLNDVVRKAENGVLVAAMVWETFDAREQR